MFSTMESSQPANPPEWLDALKASAAKRTENRSKAGTLESEHCLDEMGREFLRLVYSPSGTLKLIIRYSYLDQSRKYHELLQMNARGEVEIRHESGKRPEIRL